MRYLPALLLFFCSSCAGAHSLGLRLYDELHVHRNHSLDAVMNNFSARAYPVAVAVPLLQLVFAIAGKNKRNTAYSLQTASGLIINAALVYGLKYTVNRARPYISQSSIRQMSMMPVHLFSGHNDSGKRKQRKSL